MNACFSFCFVEFWVLVAKSCVAKSYGCDARSYGYDARSYGYDAKSFLLVALRRAFIK